MQSRGDVQRLAFALVAHRNLISLKNIKIHQSSSILAEQQYNGLKTVLQIPHKNIYR